MGTLLFLVLVFVSHFGTKFIKQLGASPFIILNIKPRSLYHHLDLMILILILDRFYHKMYLIWHLSLLTRLDTALILVSNKKIHFEVFHRWYLHNQLRALKKLFKLSFRISVANCVWFFSLQMYLCLSPRCVIIDMLREIELFHHVSYLGAYDKVVETYGMMNLKFLFSWE